MVVKLLKYQITKIYENDNTIISVVRVIDESIYFTEYLKTSEKRSSFAHSFAYSKVELDNANKGLVYNWYDFYKELEARGLAMDVLK